MNKKLLWTKLGLLILLLLLVIAILCGMFSDVSFGISLGKSSLKDYTSIENEVEIKDTLINKIDVDFINADIKIEYHDGESIILRHEGDGNLNSLYKVYENTLKVSSHVNNFKNFGFNAKKEKDLTIYIPSDLLLEYDIDNISGNATISVNADEIKFDTISGDVIASGDFQMLSADSISGVVVANISDTTTGEVKVDTISGNFDVYDNSKGLTLDFDSVSGNINDEKASSQIKSDWYQTGDGEVSISFDTISGDFTIR